MPFDIHLSPPDVGPEEEQACLAAVRSGWVAPAGPELAEFQADFDRLVGHGRHCLAVSSGTAALHLALRGLDVGPGDTVIVSDLTFVGSVAPIAYQGATPVFVDSEPESWNISPLHLEECLRSLRQRGTEPKAIITVDIYGQCASYREIVRLAREYDVPIVEDAAEAVGATYGGRPAGTFGEYGFFSFNGNKLITTGGGGMLVCSTEQAFARAHYLATQARQNTLHYEHRDIGYNYRLGNIPAAIGRAQLKGLEWRIARRRAIFSRYQEALADLPHISFMPEPPDRFSTRWLTCLLIDPAHPVGADDVARELTAAGIECRPIWKPMHLQPVFRGCQYFGSGLSARLFQSGLCLPSGSSLTEAQQIRVINELRSALRARHPVA